MTAVFYSEDARRLHIKQPRYEQGWCGATLQVPPIEYRKDFRTPICADCLDILDAKRAALHAQLDAATRWQFSKEPPAPQTVAVRAIGRFDGDTWHIYVGAALVGAIRHGEDIHWRPTAPAAPDAGQE